MTDLPVRTRIQFFGSTSAELFSREIAESFHGVLGRNMNTNPNDPMAGFVSASIDRRPWTDTMWTRDAGTFLRELVQWGAIDQAIMLAKNLMFLVRPNSQGFCTFPEYFKLGEPGSGSELDGTGAIIIGLVLLWQRLDRQDPAGIEIADFLTGERSPLKFICQQLENHPLIAGSGEFGGGCGIPGEFYNAVQNNLVQQALYAAARMSKEMGLAPLHDDYLGAAQLISKNLVRYLRGADGAWFWTIDPVTKKPDLAVNEHFINAGFGGINGLLSMTADVQGFDLEGFDPEVVDASRCNFEKLLAFPKRKAMFEKYGAWTQFDRHCHGYLTGPSYGQGYAVQAMLLMDRLDLAQKGLDFLAERTYQPFPANHLDRDSDYFFYERFYLPELLESRETINDAGGVFYDGKIFDQGCGALNLVCVAEPLKIARLIVGVDDHDPVRPRIIPRLPPAWIGYEAQNWPIMTSEGLVRANIHCERQGKTLQILVKAMDGGEIPNLGLKMPG